MPELVFIIKPQLDGASIKEVGQQIKKGLDDALGAEGSGSQPSPEEEKVERLNTKLQRLIKLNETRFRQGAITQDQALKTADRIERAARSQGLLNDNMLKGVNAQRTLFLSQQRITNGFTGMSAESARANLALSNLGRVAQDLPFGFLGISNNIDPLLQSFRQLRQETGSNKAAISALIGSLTGAGGAIFLLGSILPTALLVSQRGFNFFKKGVKESQDVLSSFISESASLQNSGFDFLGIRDSEARLSVLRGLQSQLKEYNDIVSQINTNQISVSQNGFFNPTTGFRLQDLRVDAQSLKEELGAIVDLDYKKVNDEIDKLITNLEISRALFDNDPIAKYKRALEGATDNTLRQFNLGLGTTIGDLSNYRDGLQETARVLREDFFNGNSDAIQKLEIVQDQIDKIDKLLPKLAETGLETFEDLSVDAIKFSDALENEIVNGFRAAQQADLQFAENARRNRQAQLNAEFTLLNARLRAEQRMRVQIAQDTANQIEAIERSLAQAKANLSTQVFSALTSISQALAQENQTLAIAVLGLEKALAVAQVLVKAKQEAGKAAMIGARLSLVDPSAAGRALAVVASIKATAAQTVAAIVAQGLGEGASIALRGSRTIGGGSGTGEGGAESGITVARNSNTPQGIILPQRIGGQQPKIVLNVSNNLDRKGLYIQVERGKEEFLATQI